MKELFRSAIKVPLFLAALPLALASSISHELEESKRKRKEDEHCFKEWWELGARLEHQEFLAAFEEAGSQNIDGFRVLEIGYVDVPSGKVGVEFAENFNEMLACGYELDPFEEAIVEGKHLVKALVSSANTDCIVGIKVNLGEDKIVALKPACSRGLRQQAFNERRLPSIEPDISTIYKRQEFIIALISPEAYTQMQKMPAMSDRLDGLLPLMQKSSLNDCIREEKFPDDSNAIFVEAECPEGKAFCYFGENEAGDIQAIFIDFGMFGEPEKLAPYLYR